MDASILWMIGAIAIAGAIGGAANAFISDNGFLLPQVTKTSDGTEILRPGFVGNIFVGSIASCVSWGLYGVGGEVIRSPGTLKFSCGIVR
jgi:hypothetical protein